MRRLQGSLPLDPLWRTGRHRVGPDEIVCHGDVGLWNFLWGDGKPVGLIDWDFARPGRPIRDVAQLACNAVPLRDDDVARAAGFSDQLDRRARLAGLVEGYGGFTPKEVLDAARDLQDEDLEQMGSRGRAGEQPWAGFLERRLDVAGEADRAWLMENFDRLL